MADWIDPESALPDEREPVSIRVRGERRSGWYRVADRWYALDDLDRWIMNTSRYWAKDRSWYLKTDEVQAWQPETNSS